MRRFNVLIVEDTAFEIKKLTQILSSMCEIKIVRNGEDCLEALKKYKVDLILLDILMDGISGFDVLEQLREDEDYCEIPVIFVTSSMTTEDEIRGLSLGAVDYVTKPLVPEIVKYRVQRELNRLALLETIMRMSLRDALTGLENRRSFDESYKKEWERAVRLNHKTKVQGIGLLVSDIDFFKKFNDSYGHPGGDLCLRQFGAIIRKTFSRSTDRNFRYGGEEFVVILIGVSYEDLLTMGQKFVDVVRKTPIKIEDKTVKITVSVGGGYIQPDTSSIDKQVFFDMVDKMVYKAKSEGRDRFVCLKEIL